MRQIPLCDVEGITVSGGEPFEQAGELVQLLEAAKEAGLHRLVYTGFLYEELADMKDDTIDRVFAETNILIDGAYQQNNPSKAPWIGSGNQRILFMDKGKTGEAADAGSLAGYAGDGEIWIDHSGNVTATGIFDSRALGKAV
jgi:anaerobic ribonucleoside-triphosphate reductase activating protein